MAFGPFGRLLSLLAPLSCAACDAELEQDVLLCGACDVVEAPLVEPMNDDLIVVASGRYDGPLAEAIRRMKYGGRPDLARHLGARVARAVHAAKIDGPFTLVPVPLHPKRLAERGYNQSALIARHAGRSLRLPSNYRGLSRTRETLEQASLVRDDRLANTQDAFRSLARIHGRVLLIDDVVTTGATATACAEALRRAGAAVVGVAAVARVT
jgi:ComF family protein